MLWSRGRGADGREKQGSRSLILGPLVLAAL